MKTLKKSKRTCLFCMQFKVIVLFVRVKVYVFSKICILTLKSLTWTLVFIQRLINKSPNTLLHSQRFTKYDTCKQKNLLWVLKLQTWTFLYIFPSSKLANLRSILWAMKIIFRFLFSSKQKPIFDQSYNRSNKIH